MWTACHTVWPKYPFPHTCTDPCHPPSGVSGEILACFSYREEQKTRGTRALHTPDGTSGS